MGSCVVRRRSPCVSLSGHWYGATHLALGMSVDNRFEKWRCTQSPSHIHTPAEAGGLCCVFIGEPQPIPDTSALAQWAASSSLAAQGSDDPATPEATLCLRVQELCRERVERLRECLEHFSIRRLVDLLEQRVERLPRLRVGQPRGQSATLPPFEDLASAPRPIAPSRWERDRISRTVRPVDWEGVNLIAPVDVSSELRSCCPCPGAQPARGSGETKTSQAPRPETWRLRDRWLCSFGTS